MFGDCYAISESTVREIPGKETGRLPLIRQDLWVAARPVLTISAPPKPAHFASLTTPIVPATGLLRNCCHARNPVIRWGKPYESIDKAPVVHFETGEQLAVMHQANAGLIKMDLRKAAKARDILREFSIEQLCDMAAKAADLYLEGTLPLGNGTQTPQEFCKIQSATTGLPEAMCAANMRKNAYVLRNMKATLEALTRGLPFEILSRGYGMESRGIMVSFQAQTPIIGLVLPSNSPGVHTLWMPVIPLQVGLVLKPGSSEPWTPYRVYEAFAQAGVPREAFCIYPGPQECGGAIMEMSPRSMIFGSQQTVDRYKGDPRVQAHARGSRRSCSATTWSTSGRSTWTCSATACS